MHRVCVMVSWQFLFNTACKWFYVSSSSYSPPKQNFVIQVLQLCLLLSDNQLRPIHGCLKLVFKRNGNFNLTPTVGTFSPEDMLSWCILQPSVLLIFLITLLTIYFESVLAGPPCTVPDRVCYCY